MGLMSSLYTGVAGVNANSQTLQVVGDNISNVNTAGFKSARVNFQDMLSDMVNGGTGPAQVGRGAKVQNIEQIFSNGSLQSTGKATDMAISGNGFFVVQGDLNGTEGRFYTRAGQFNISSDGYLVNPLNLRVQGYTTDSNGNLTSSVDDINVTASTLRPNETNLVEIVANLDARTTSPIAIPNASDMETEPGQKSNFATTISVYDSRGGNHQLEVHFVKLKNVTDDRQGSATASPDANVSWNYHVLARTSELDHPVPNNVGANYIQIGGGTLDFNASGALVKVDKVNDPQKSGWATFKGAEGQQIDLNFMGAAKLNQTGQASTKVEIGANLRIDQATATLTAAQVEGGTTPHFTKTMEVFDQQGVKHQLKIAFVKVAQAERLVDNPSAAPPTGSTHFYNWHIMAKSEDLKSGSPAPLNSGNAWSHIAGGTSYYDTNGALIGTESKSGANYNGQVNWKNDSSATTVSFNFSGSDTASPTTPSSKGLKVSASPFQLREASANGRVFVEGAEDALLSGMTCFSASSSLTLQKQNGFSTGSLQNLSVDTNGILTGGFSNGENRTLGQVAIANFQNQTGIKKFGSNLYIPTQNSGNAIIGKAGSGGRGSISANAIEQSNVDLASEFITLIQAQRAFQSAGRIITTSDQFLAEVVNLKR